MIRLTILLPSLDADFMSILAAYQASIVHADFGASAPAPGVIAAVAQMLPTVLAAQPAVQPHCTGACAKDCNSCTSCNSPAVFSTLSADACARCGTLGGTIRDSRVVELRKVQLNGEEKLGWLCNRCFTGER